jgi:hypothetical protein
MICMLISLAAQRSDCKRDFGSGCDGHCRFATCAQLSFASAVLKLQLQLVHIISMLSVLCRAETLLN